MEKQYEENKKVIKERKKGRIIKEKATIAMEE